MGLLAGRSLLAAASVTRAGSSAGHLLAVCSAARAVARRNSDLAQRLFLHHPWLQSWLVVSRGAPRLQEPPAFAAAYDQARLLRANLELDIGAPSPGIAPPSKALCNLERRQFWSPFAKKAPLCSVLWEGHSSSDRPGRLHALASFWAPTFERPIAMDAAAIDRIRPFVAPCSFP